MPRPDRARTANEGIPLQIVDRTTIVASAIGVRGHKKPHVIEAERSGQGLGHLGGAKRRPRPEGGPKSAATTESNTLPFKRC